MLQQTEQLLRDAGSELVFGLVGPVGADMELFERDLSDHLRQYGYSPVSIRVSALLKKVDSDDLGVQLSEISEFDRIMSYMDAGNCIRQRTKASEILALWAIAEICSTRIGDPPSRKGKTAFILRSLKHPDEVRALRAVYGPGFFLIGVAVGEGEQLEYLQATKGFTEGQARKVIARDKGEGEDQESGQQMRDAFELADVFIKEDRCRDSTRRHLERFLTARLRCRRRDADRGRGCHVPCVRLIASFW
jgi:hypothetical protein